MAASKTAERSSLSSMRASVQSKIQHTIDYAQMPPVYKIPLWELNCGFGLVKKKHAETVELRQAVRYQRKAQSPADVTMVFAIRQAGWAACREHGLQLTQLAAQDRKLALLATVKETGVDDGGLLEFYQDYFNSYPIYKDEKWLLYKAMGGKTLCVFGLFKAVLGAKRRLDGKKIKSSKNNNKSKVAWMTGGVLIFDKSGELVYVMEENTGQEFDMEQIQLAIQEARCRNAERAANGGGDNSVRKSDTSALSR